tara:strand:- start:458 stop:724 length:267 start_codon:yes stop_codon:yes gene_type:complete
MALNTKEQMNLAEAAIAVQNERKENKETKEGELSESDAVALNFIANALGEPMINESTEKEYTEAITNLVESLNYVCWSVNDYFGLNQD